MVEQTVELCREVGAGADREEILPALALAACEQLRARLRSGVRETDCGEVFPLAAAMIALDTLRELEGENGIASFTAGEVSIRCDASRSLVRAARRLMAPWTTDGSFAFRGVRG